MPFEFSPVSDLATAVLGPLPSLISSATYLCFFVHSEELFDTARSSIEKETPYVVISDETVPTACSHLVFIDATAEEITTRLKTVERLSWEKHVICVNRKTLLDMGKIQKSSEVFKTSIAVFHYDNQTLALGSPFDEPQGEARRLIPYDERADFTTTDDLKNYGVLSTWVDRSVIERYIIAEFHINISKSEKYNATVKYYGALGKLYKELSWYLGFHDRVIPGNPESVLVLFDYCTHFSFDKPHDCSPANLSQKIAPNRSDIFVGFNLHDPFVRENLRGVGPVVWEFRNVLLVRRPTSTPPGALAPLATFTPGTWCLLCLSFATAAVAYWLLAGRRESASDVFFNLLGLLALAGNSPRRSVSALVLVAWSLFAIFNAAALTSELLDRATLPVFKPRVDTWAYASKLGYYFWHYKSLYVELLKDNSTENRKAYGKLRLRKMYEELERDEHAMVGALISGAHDIVIFPLTSNGSSTISKLRAMKESYLEGYATINTNRESAVYPAVNRGAQRLLETGIYHYQMREAMRERHAHRGYLSPHERQLRVEKDLPQYDATQLTAETLKLPFAVLAAGVCLSLCFLVMEIVHDKLKKDRLRARNARQLFTHFGNQTALRHLGRSGHLQRQQPEIKSSSEENCIDLVCEDLE